MSVRSWRCHPNVEIVSTQGKRYAVNIQRRDMLSERRYRQPRRARRYRLWASIGCHASRQLHRFSYRAGNSIEPKKVTWVFPARLPANHHYRMQWLYYGSTMVITLNPIAKASFRRINSGSYYDASIATGQSGLSARLPVPATSKIWQSKYGFLALYVMKKQNCCHWRKSSAAWTGHVHSGICSGKSVVIWIKITLNSRD